LHIAHIKLCSAALTANYNWQEKQLSNMLPHVEIEKQDRSFAILNSWILLLTTVRKSFYGGF
jgi:hypothetical protein